MITAAKKYFGIAEARGFAISTATAACFSIVTSSPIDLILCDAYHGGYIPFHLLTKEFSGWSSSI